MRSGTHVWCAAWALALSLAAPQASASPLFETAGDTSGFGGLNARASAAGAGSASTYFNPALLTRARRGLELGTSILWESVDVTLDRRPAGADVPLGIRGSSHAETWMRDGLPVITPTIEPDSIATQWLEQGCAPPDCVPGFAARPRGEGTRSDALRVYQTLGLVLPLFDDHVIAGVHAMIPLDEFTTAHSYFVDEREQFFTNSLHPELYGDRLTATSLAFGAGVPLTPRLSLGLSATIALRNGADAGTFVSNSDNQAETLLLSTDVEVRARLAPHLGLAWQATDRLHLSATAHSPQRFDIGTAFSTTLPDGNEQRAVRSATHDYLPWTASVGAELVALDAPSLRVDVAATLELARWYTYVNRQSERPQQGYEWSDTFTPTLGARATRNDWRTFVDVSYRPTPVPAQTGRTNYVDNDRVSAAAGVDHLLRARTTNIRVGAHIRAHALIARHQTKIAPAPNPILWEGDDRFGAAHYDQLVIDEVPDDAIDGLSRRGEPLAGREGLQTNNPGFPGFASRGVVLGGGVTVAFEY